jgi:Fusaric acid resistance protein-like
MRPLRANLNWQSPALRHALRTAVTAALPLAFTMFWFMPYDHWLTISVVATMQPYFSLTYTRALERIAGTALGGAIAAAVGLIATTPISIAAAMFLLSTSAFSIRAVSFGLFMMALTPLVVLLVETGSPDTTLLGEKTDAQLGQARRAAGVSSNALEALMGATIRLAAPSPRAGRPVTRALLEPGKQNQDPLEAAMVIDAALRRCAGRLASVQHDPRLATAESRETLRTWRDWVGQSMHRLSEGKTDLLPRPPGSTTDALSRIARQIELMAGTMKRPV